MLTPGDSVRIVVWRKPEFSGDYIQTIEAQHAGERFPGRSWNGRMT
jgi:protein involved in polysaccharide export with SLBB domain